MAQNWTDDCFASGHNWDSDMQALENNFGCLKSLFSGATAPSNPVAGMPWFDTTKKLLKHRDNANSAWRGILAGSASFKMLVYLDAAEDGWAIDSTVTDKVIALKGGSIYATGGATAGSWTLSGVTIPNHVHSHLHQWYKSQGTSQNDKTYDASGAEVNAGPLKGDNKNSSYRTIFLGWINTTGQADTYLDMYTSLNSSSDGGGGSVVSDAAWRPAAAVCTLQYPDV